MRLSLSRQKGATIRCELRDGETLLMRDSSRFNGDRDFEKVAKSLDIDVALLKSSVDLYEDGGSSVVDLGGDEDAVTFSVRSLQGVETTTFPSFAEALAATDLDYVEPIITWNGCSAIAALDLDAKEGYEWDHAKLLLLDTVPTPAYSWVTKSGGLRLIYERSGIFSAEHVAATALIALRQTPHKSLEVKSDTRHPSYAASDGSHCGSILRREQEFNPGHLRRWLSMYTVTDNEVAQYLEDKGMEPGGLYEHVFCPVDREYVSHGKPVTVNDNGIYCFSCNARGVHGGSSKPGFFPFSFLCGSRTDNLLHKCMEAGTHWEHARFVVEAKLGLTGRYARLIYEAGVLLCNPDTKRLHKIMTSGANLIRMGDLWGSMWTNCNGERYSKDIKPILASLPVVCNGPKGQPDRALIAELEQSFDHSKHGYPPITPIYGMRIIPPNPQELTAVIQPRALSDDSMIAFRGKYIPFWERPATYWEALELVFPGVNRNFLKLLIAARGIVEGAISMPPMLMVTGVTGAGKSLTVFLAASICGDVNTEIVWTNNTDRLRQAVMDAPGQLCTLNEVMKEAKGAASAMDFLLNLTPDSKSHRMYDGPTRMGRLPVMVLTDTEIAPAVKADAQLGRRLVHVNLTGAVDWEPSLKAAGVRHPSDYRISSEQAARLCNCIVSEVMDQFWPRDGGIDGAKSFHDIAKELGFNRLCESDEARESKEALKRLFETVCAAPEANGEAFVSGRGWKIVKRDMESAIRTAWLAVAEDNFTSSRHCSAEDWRRLLGKQEAVYFDLRSSGSNKIAIRFRNANGGLVNGELL